MRTNAYQITFRTHSHEITSNHWCHWCISNDSYDSCISNHFNCNSNPPINTYQNSPATDRKMPRARRDPQCTAKEPHNTESPIIQRATTQHTQHYNITTQTAPRFKGLQHNTHNTIISQHNTHNTITLQHRKPQSTKPYTTRQEVLWLWL